MEQIVKIRTSDHKALHGLLTTPKSDSKTVLINIHGTASNFYIEDFMPVIAAELAKNGVATLATNNRGANALKGWEKGGCTEEIFEDCLLDIDAWVNYAVDAGFEQIILSGHSLGTEKVVYYMAKGEHKERVAKVILLAPADSYGYEKEFLKTVKADLFKEAHDLVEQGDGQVFLTGEWFCHGGVLPKSAESFLNFFSPNSELSKTLPFSGSQGWELYQSITVPIMAVISDNQKDEYTIIPIKEALEVLKQNNPLTETRQIVGTDHCFYKKEQELAEIISKFIKR